MRSGSLVTARCARERQGRDVLHCRGLSVVGKRRHALVSEVRGPRTATTPEDILENLQYGTLVANCGGKFHFYSLLHQDEAACHF
ncbi:hypothetical protein KCP75_18050 [Salmonella enterica subsp. enterica]|nr:hypothetical protein KCP75_18050 [Salmonella enterica subsp. enterica]